MDALQLLAEYPEEALYLRVKPQEIDLFNKLIEAYDNTALVTTIDAEAGRLALWVTADTKPAVLKIMTKLPCRVELELQPIGDGR